MVLPMVLGPTLLYTHVVMDTIFSAAVVCLNISYALPVFIRVAFCQSILDTSNFNLGRCSFSVGPLLHEDKAAASKQPSQQLTRALAMQLSADSQVAAGSQSGGVAWEHRSSRVI